MYFHGKTVDGNRYTIAGIVENDDLLLGISLCSDHDAFSKVKGRRISSGRVLNQRTSARCNRKSFYAMTSIDGGGFSENYFVGQECKIFRAYVSNYNFFTKKELISEFGLHS